MFGSDDPLGRGRAVLALPRRSLLSNGRYQVLLTESGTGFSRIGDRALTVWSADPLADQFGFFLYVRDLGDGSFWSVGRRPCLAAAADGQAAGAEVERGVGWHRMTRTVRGIRMDVETGIIPDADGELRRLRLWNLESRSRSLEITTYGEVALQSTSGFAGHPAFSRLFVGSEFEAASRALLFRRRPRANGEVHPWMVHALLEGDVVGWETDRARFLGRGRSPRAPRALSEETALSGTTGDVLDPIFCLRTVVELKAAGEARCSFALGAAPDRAAALAMLRALDPGGIDGAFAESARREATRLRSCGLTPHDAGVWETLAGSLLYRDPGGRDPGVVWEPGGANRLRALGLSMNRPFLLLSVPAPVSNSIEREIVAGCRYWADLGLDFDVVVLSGTEAVVFAGSLAPGSPSPDLPAREASAPRRPGQSRAHAVDEPATATLRASAAAVLTS